MRRLYFALCVSALGAQMPPLSLDPARNPLPMEALAFPEFSENYRAKILSGDYEIWSEEKILRWSSAQGLTVSRDQPGGGLQYRRAAVIAAPGMTFTLTRPVTEKGSELANGWRLVLDIGAIYPREGLSTQQSGVSPNFLDCDIYIDGVLAKKILQSPRKQIASPVEIQIPHIRSVEGKITVSVRLANHPRNFLFLYDAYLMR